MRAAKEQAEELDQAGAFLNSLLTPGAESSRPQATSKEAVSHRQIAGRVKAPKMEHVARFADPPAPPPQQPLPEKPDSSKASPVATPFTNLLKRGETAKPSKNESHSPTNPQNSQMLSLIEALSIAKKELDSQGARVKQLEDMLKQERSAREDAEERARRLEQHAASRPVSQVEESPAIQVQPTKPGSDEQESIHDSDGELDAKTKHLQQNLDQVLGEMQRLKSDVDKFQRRAETAETDAAHARKSLAEMIDKIRVENEKAESLPKQLQERPDNEGSEAEAGAEPNESTMKSAVKSRPQVNGHIRPPVLPEHLERAVATVLRDRSSNADAIAQSAPYVSMLGVVLIGVGLMAYLNSWQKSER
ncbi:hypothetical protein CLCR_00057 [Cladophialophora carrionii]|uniref:Uncharacterized protein n=1 Tax=Cladophialophora carrionii TaxID=86049 RepID=A0A1C1CBG8_9EURO|nr:hypothetical protein CLCR_00057 [Cladophialophora carrionii]